MVFNNRNVMKRNPQMHDVKKLVMIWLICLSSCGFNAHKGALNLYFDEVEKGESSLKIFKQYGPSQQMWRDGDTNVFSYSYTKPKYSFVSFLPIPVFKSKFDNYEVVLTFDDKGNVMDVIKFHDRVIVRSWLVCDYAIVDCDVERVKVQTKFNGDK